MSELAGLRVRHGIGACLVLLAALLVAGCEGRVPGEFGLSPLCADLTDESLITSTAMSFSVTPATETSPGTTGTPVDGWYCFGDEIRGAYPGDDPWPAGGCPNPLLGAIEGDEQPPGCNEATQSAFTGAMIIQFSGHNYWGGEVASYSWFATGVPTAGNLTELKGPADGIYLWAKTTTESDKFVTVYLTDMHSADLSGVTPADGEPSIVDPCVSPDTSAAANQDEVNVTVVSSDPNVATSNSSNQNVIPLPDHCGNRFGQLLELSDHWDLHLMPFDRFYQEAKPNREPGGIDASEGSLRGISFNMPRGAHIDLSIAEIGFYREAASGEQQ